MIDHIGWLIAGALLGWNFGGWMHRHRYDGAAWDEIARIMKKWV